MPNLRSPSPFISGTSPTALECLFTRRTCQYLIKEPYRLPHPAEKMFRVGYFFGTEERVVPHRGTMPSTPRNGVLLGVGENGRAEALIHL
ncbi:hypothetical protein C3V43_08675 [Bacteroides heparinolyticus]|nr:hypothetical protein C3V43_08675 [Bacteroides heparinolyticus]